MTVAGVGVPVAAAGVTGGGAAEVTGGVAAGVSGGDVAGAGLALTCAGGSVAGGAGLATGGIRASVLGVADPRVVTMPPSDALSRTEPDLNSAKKREDENDSGRNRYQHQLRATHRDLAALTALRHPTARRIGCHGF